MIRRICQEKGGSAPEDSHGRIDEREPDDGEEVAPVDNLSAPGEEDHREDREADHGLYRELGGGGLGIASTAQWRREGESGDHLNASAPQHCGIDANCA